jgi:hypothetical protein
MSSDTQVARPVSFAERQVARSLWTPVSVARRNARQHPWLRCWKLAERQILAVVLAGFIVSVRLFLTISVARLSTDDALDA